MKISKHFSATFLFGLCLLICLPGKSRACSCGQLSAEDRFTFADAVFSGEVLGITDSKITVAADKSWKGVTTAEIELIPTESDCDPDFKLHKKYLIYARQIKDGLRTGKCEGAIELTSPEEQLAPLAGKELLAIKSVGSTPSFYILIVTALILSFIFYKTAKNLLGDKSSNPKRSR